VGKGVITALLVLVGAWAAAPALAEESGVARGVYATGIQEREPTGLVTVLPKDSERVYFYTELRNLAGQTVTHRWQHGGQTVLEIPFEVKAARWRVWSSKEIQPGVTGELTVLVVDGNGKELMRAVLPVGP